MPIRLLSGDADYAVVYTVCVQGEVCARHLNLGVMSIETGIISVRLNDITTRASR